MKFKRILSALLCVLMLTSSFVFTANAASDVYNIYVSATGDDAAAGTSEGAPVKTIKQAAALANALSSGTAVQINLLTDITETLITEHAGDFNDTIGALTINGNGHTLTFSADTTEAGWDNFCNTSYKNIKLNAESAFPITYTGYDMSFDADCVFNENIRIEGIVGGREAHKTSPRNYRNSGATVNIDATGTLGFLGFTDYDYGTHDKVLGTINVNIGVNNTGNALTIKKYSLARMPVYTSNKNLTWTAENLHYMEAEVDFNIVKANIEQLAAVMSPDDNYADYQSITSNPGGDRKTKNYVLNGYPIYTVGSGAVVTNFVIDKARKNLGNSSSVTAKGTLVLVVDNGGTVTAITESQAAAGTNYPILVIKNDGATIGSISQTKTDFHILNVTGGAIEPVVEFDTEVDTTIYRYPTLTGFKVKSGTDKAYAVITDSTGDEEKYMIDANGVFNLALNNLEAGTYDVSFRAAKIITFDAGEGSFADGTKVINKEADDGDKVLTIAPADPTYRGYEFKGWSLDPSATNVVIADENTEFTGPFQTYKAVWEPIPAKEYVINSLKIKNSANAIITNDTINRKYVADRYLNNSTLNEENGITVSLPHGWPTNVMPQFEATSENGGVTYTAPSEFENGKAAGNISIQNTLTGSEKNILVNFEIANASSQEDISVENNFQSTFGISESDKGYNIEQVAESSFPSDLMQDDVKGPSTKLSLNGKNKPTNLTWSFPDYLCVDDTSYIRILAYYDTGVNKEIDTEIDTASKIEFATQNCSGNLNATQATIHEAYALGSFAKNDWQYLYYDLRDCYGYTNELNLEIFGGKNASAYSDSDDALYIAEIKLINVDSDELDAPLKRHKPTGITIASHAYEGQAGELSNVPRDTTVSTTGADGTWSTVQRFVQSIGGTYSAGVLSGLDEGTYYLRYSELDEFSPSQSVSFKILQDWVFLEFYDENDELIIKELVEYSDSEYTYTGDAPSKDNYQFQGWSTNENATEAESVIPDANKKFYPVFKTTNNVYVSATGTGDGLTAQTPMSDIADAWDMVAVNGGTITVIGTVDVPATSLAATNKDIVITGGTLNVGSGMSFAQNSTGKITFTDINLTGTGKINLNGKETEFTDTVTGAYTVSAGNGAKLTLRGGTPTVEIDGSVKIISSIGEITTTGDATSAQIVTYTAADDCGVEFTEDAYKVTATNKYAVVTAVDGAKKENVKLISNIGNMTLANGSYTVSFYDTEADIPVTINIYDGTGHLETLSKKLGDTYSYTGDVTTPAGKDFTGFEGDGVVLGVDGENTVTEIPENANINLYAKFENDTNIPYWHTVGTYNSIEQIYTLDLLLSYNDTQVTSGAIGLNFEALGNSFTVEYADTVTNIEEIVYDNAENSQHYVVAFSGVTFNEGVPSIFTATSEGEKVATFTFTGISQETYDSLTYDSITIFEPYSANPEYLSDEYWQVACVDAHNPYAPKYVNSFLADLEKGSVQDYDKAEITLNITLDGAADNRIVNEHSRLRFGYKPTNVTGDYTYIYIEEAGKKYGKTVSCTVNAADFAVGVEYDFVIVKRGYSTVESTFILEQTQQYDIKLEIGDAAGENNKIDATDFNAVMSAFDADAAAEVKAKADIDEDGYATVFDLAIILAKYNSSLENSFENAD